MDTSLYELIAKGGVGALGVYLLSIAFPKLVDSFAAARGSVAESGARVDIIEQLSAQVLRLNQSVLDLESKHKAARADFEAERDRRIEAEDLVDKLQRNVDAATARIDRLEKQIKDLGHTPV